MFLLGEIYGRIYYADDIRSSRIWFGAQITGKK